MEKYYSRIIKLIAVNICLLLISGCATYNNNYDYLTPVSFETIAAYEKVGSPIKNRLDAVINAQISMQGSRLGFVGNPQVVYAEKINFKEAIKRVKAGDQFLSQHPVDKKVWLVIFEGELQWIFPMPDDQGIVPTSAHPYHGCMYSINGADGGGASIVGDVSCEAKLE